MQRRDDSRQVNKLVGDKITVNDRTVHVSKLLDEGGFSYVYLVNDAEGGSSGGAGQMVLKVTSIHSRQQREIAEKEAMILSRLKHPSIVTIFDSCHRNAPQQTSGIIGGLVGTSKGNDYNSQTERSSQHLILMEFCEGGHVLDVCNQLAAAGKRFELKELIMVFGQICNAVTYLHAQRPPIVHRDLKPVNFLVKNGAYKLCDFGSAVFGHVELKTQKARQEAEEVIQRTTTQMFRAPEMVDLYTSSKLTQSTDVWAMGCCLYSMAFQKNCFEEGSNLAILSRNYKIPEDNPYGDKLVDLIDRMLTADMKARADMTDVILCLSAMHRNEPLPERRRPKSRRRHEEDEVGTESDATTTMEASRIDSGTSQADRKQSKSHHGSSKKKSSKKSTVKKLPSDSVAARRREKSLRDQHVSSMASDRGRSGSPGGAKNPLFDGSFLAFDDIPDSNLEADLDAAFPATALAFGNEQTRTTESGESTFATFGGNEQSITGSAQFQSFDRAWAEPPPFNQQHSSMSSDTLELRMEGMTVEESSPRQSKRGAKKKKRKDNA